MGGMPIGRVNGLPESLRREIRLNLPPAKSHGGKAHRLKKRISDCPVFDDPIDIYVWKAGYRSARDNVSKSTALAALEDVSREIVINGYNGENKSKDDIIIKPKKVPKTGPVFDTKLDAEMDMFYRNCKS